MNDHCKLCHSPVQRLVHLLIPPVRTYIRFAPGNRGKRAVWSGFVEPRLSRHSHAFTARTRYGQRLAGNQVTVMPRCIYYFGLWEAPLTSWIHETLQPGDTFVDVGANMGYFSLLAATRVGPRGSVVALEPARPTFRKLRTNIALNRARNVRAVRAAAAAVEGEVPFYRAENDAESSTLPIPGFEREPDVPAMPLARLLSEEELARTRVIKIDVEGGEADVVAGLLPGLERLRPDVEIAVEMHPHLLAVEGKTVSDIFGMLEPAGFVPYWLPVDFAPLAHLEPPRRVRPLRLTAPKDELVDVIFSRRRASEL